MHCTKKLYNPCIAYQYIQFMMIPINSCTEWWSLITTCVAWPTSTSSVRALHNDTKHQINYVIILFIAWRYHSSNALYNNTRTLLHIHCMMTSQWMMIPFITRSAWLNHSSQASYKTIPGITYHHIRCLTTSIIKCIAWWFHSSQAVYDDPYHHNDCMMIHIITMIAWW